MEGGCNVIPVMDNFCWPPVEHLPEDMRAVCYFNGIRYVIVCGTQGKVQRVRSAGQGTWGKSFGNVLHKESLMRKFFENFS